MDGGPMKKIMTIQYTRMAGRRRAAAPTGAKTKPQQ
jgi:hypothetical protein